MRTINIAIEKENGLLMLNTNMKNKAVGTMYDNGEQRFRFTRLAELNTYDMVLMLNYGYGWVEEDLGTGNAFVLTDTHTQNDELKLQVVLYEGDEYRCGTNIIKFLFRESSRGKRILLPPSGDRPEIVSIPAEFPAIPFSFAINNDGNTVHNYTFDQFKDSYEEIYVAGSNGSDSTGDGSVSKPFATMQKAFDTAEAGTGSSYIIKTSAPLITRNYSFAVKTITKNISVVGTGNTKTILPTAVEQLVWTEDGTGTWKATRSGVYAVFDLGATDTYGEPTPYDNVLTLEECQEEAGSWYADNTAVWVHTTSGSSPTTGTHAVCMNQNLFNITVTNDATLYLENLRFIAGRENNGLNIMGDGNIQGTFIANGCSFLGSNLRNTGATTKLGNSLAVQDIKNTYLFNCVAAYSGRDGFNYHFEKMWANSATKGRIRECVVVEYNCISYNHGIYSQTGADNATTCHEGACIIRIGCEGHKTSGPVLHDTMGCLSYMVDCHMQDSAGVGNKDAAFYFDNDSAVEDGKAWLVNSSGGGDNYSLNSGDGFVLYLSNFSGDRIPAGLNITYLD